MLCSKCLGKLDLEKSYRDELKQEYHLVWKNIDDRTKYPSILHDYDIITIGKQYKRKGKTIYAKTDEEQSNDIIGDLCKLRFGAEFI